MLILMYISSIEISPSLAKIQKETVAQVGSHLSKFRVECRDASDLSGWSEFLFFSLVMQILYLLFFSCSVAKLELVYG